MSDPKAVDAKTTNRNDVMLIPKHQEKWQLFMSDQRALKAFVSNSSDVDAKTTNRNDVMSMQKNKRHDVLLNLMFIF